MATVKAIKQRRSMSEAFEGLFGDGVLPCPLKQSEEPFDWWGDIVSLINQWLEASPILADDGTFELIRTQLERGSQFPGIRKKCWKHIVLELETAPSHRSSRSQSNSTTNLFEVTEDSQSSKADSLLAKLLGRKDCFETPKQSSRRRSSHDQDMETLKDIREAAGFCEGERDHQNGSEIAEPTLSAAEPGLSDVQVNHTAVEEATMDAATNTTASSSNRLSMLERQNKFLQQKQEKLERMKVEQEEKIKQNLTFAPDMQASNISRVNSKKEIPLPVKRNSRSNMDASITNTANLLKKANTFSAPPTKGTKARRQSTGQVKDKAQMLRQSSDTTPGHEAAVRRTSFYSSMQEGIDLLKSCSDAALVSTHDSASEIVSSEKANEETAPDNIAERVEEPVPDNPDPDAFSEGTFFTRIDDDQQLGYRSIRESEQFVATSMYKRKDRVTKQLGLSLLCGKIDRPPNEEKVISLIFDLATFSEEQAYKWWLTNRHRL